MILGGVNKAVFRRATAGILILIVAGCLVGACCYALWSLSNTKASSEDEGVYVQACVLTRSMLRGEIISEDDVSMATWLADLAPAEVITDMSLVVGQTVNHAMPARSLLTSFDISPHDHQLIIPPGCDAVSVESSQVKAVAGALAPGSLVDVYCQRDGRTYLLLEQVTVLDIAPDAMWITLAITPDRVQEVIAASSMKALYFSKPGTSVQSSMPTDAADTSSNSGSNSR